MATPTYNKYKIEGEFMDNGVLYYDPMVKQEYLDNLKTWTADHNDVILAAYPNTDSQWLSTIVHHVFREGDIELADAAFIPSIRIPFLENVYPEGKPPTGAQKLDKLKPPRTAKTHLGYTPVMKQVEEDKAKFIVVFRNPKDAIVSYYHYYRTNKSTNFFSGSFHEFFQLFHEKRLRYGDIIDWSEGWWRNVGRLNILPIRYEDMIEDNQEKHVRSISEFCGKEFSDDLIEHISSACSFATTKRYITRDATTDLYHQVGSWKNFMTQEEADYVDERCKNLKEMGFPM